jgi:hypothetical protein
MHYACNPRERSYDNPRINRAKIVSDLRRSADAWEAEAQHPRHRSDPQMLQAYQSDARDLRRIADDFERGEDHRAFEAGRHLDTIVRDQLPQAFWDLILADRRSSQRDDNPRKRSHAPSRALDYQPLSADEQESVETALRAAGLYPDPFLGSSTGYRREIGESLSDYRTRMIALHQKQRARVQGTPAFSYDENPALYEDNRGATGHLEMRGRDIFEDGRMIARIEGEGRAYWEGVYTHTDWRIHHVDRRGNAIGPGVDTGAEYFKDIRRNLPAIVAKLRGRGGRRSYEENPAPKPALGSHKKVRYPEGLMTETEWIQNHAASVEEYTVPWENLADRRTLNRLGGSEYEEYVERMKAKAEKPRYRAWSKMETFHDIPKATYEWAISIGIPFRTINR